MTSSRHIAGSEIVDKQLPKLPEEKEQVDYDDEGEREGGSGAVDNYKSIHSKFDRLNLKENYLGQVPEVPRRDRDRGPRRVNGLPVGSVGDSDRLHGRRPSDSASASDGRKLSRRPSGELLSSSLTRRSSDTPVSPIARRPSADNTSSLARRPSADTAYSLTRISSVDSAVASRRPSAGSKYSFRRPSEEALIPSTFRRTSDESDTTAPVPRRRASDTSSRPSVSKRHSAPSTRHLSTVPGNSISPRRMSGGGTTMTYSNENADSVAAAAVVAQEMNNVQALKRLSLGALPTLDPDLPQFSSFYNEANLPNMNRRSLGNGTPPVPVVVPSGGGPHSGLSSSSSSSSSRSSTPSSSLFSSTSSSANITKITNDISSSSSVPVGRSFSSGSNYRLSTPSHDAGAAPRRSRSSGQQPLHIVTELKNKESSDQLQQQASQHSSPVSPLSSNPVISSQHASQLLWVPANVHPELAPQEWKSFVQQKVAEIRATISPQQPSSLSNESSSSSLSNSSSEESLAYSSGTKLSRRNTRLSREISDQAEYTDGSDVLENRRKSRGASSTTPEDLTSLSSLSAQLKSLGELESLAMDPFQLARSLSRNNVYGYGSTYGTNTGSFNHDEGTAASATEAQSTHDFQSSAGTLSEIEPLPNDSDQPIMPAPSPSLRRAAHTRYNKPSLRKGRQRAASSSKHSEEESRLKTEKDFEEKEEIKQEESNQEGEKMLEEKPPRQLQQALQLNHQPRQEQPQQPRERTEVQESQKMQRQQPIESQFRQVEPLNISKDHNELPVSTDSELMLSHVEQNDHILEDSKSRPETFTFSRSSSDGGISTPAVQPKRSATFHTLPTKELSDSNDNDMTSTDIDVSAGFAKSSSDVASNSALSASIDTISAPPVGRNYHGFSSKSDDDLSVGSKISSPVASPNKPKSRKNWRWLFNGGAANGNNHDSSSEGASGKISEQVIMLSERGSSDDQSPESPPVASPTSATSAVFDRKGISSFFSKMKVRKESDEQTFSTGQAHTDINSSNKSAPSSPSLGAAPNISHEVKERHSRGVSDNKKKGVTKSRYRSRSRSRARSGQSDDNRKHRGDNRAANNQQKQKDMEQQQRQLEQQLQQQQYQMQQYDGGLPYHIPAHQMSDKSMVMMYHRYPLHIERAIYRLSHLKLANPRRPLVQQVLLSNFMYAYLNLINHGYQQQMQQLQQLQLQQLEDMKHSQQGQQSQLRQDSEYVDGYQEIIGEDSYEYGYDNFGNNDRYSGYEDGYGQVQYYDQDQYDDSQQVQYQQDHRHVIYEEDTTAMDADPKKSPSAGSTSSSSSSSSADANENLWHGEDETNQEYDLQEKVS